MKKTLFTLLVLLLPTVISAQHFHLKLGGGIASHIKGSQSIGAFKIGIGYEYELSQKWTILSSLVAYGKGWKEKDQVVNYYDDNHELVYNDDGSIRTGIKNRTTTANYLEIPVVFNYYLRTGESRYVVFSAGPYIACGISGKQKTKGDTEEYMGRRLYYESKTFKEHGVHRFDTGLTAGLGYQFPAHITLGVEADFGLTKFNTEGDRNLTVLVALSYQFGL
ncbi:MAG: PorT family protein [Alloprevotella sp.]|nr:PorT family protein [Alloprevotella sp.]